MGSLTIGQAARMADVNVETIRFYERKGLVEQPAKLDRRVRRYPESVVDRARFIKEAQQLGFSLAETRGLLDLQVDAVSSCTRVEPTALEVKKKVGNKNAKLKRMSAALHRLCAGCRPDEKLRGDSLIQALK